MKPGYIKNKEKNDKIFFQGTNFEWTIKKDEEIHLSEIPVHIKTSSEFQKWKNENNRIE